jgi:hypothetical protein
MPTCGMAQLINGYRFAKSQSLGRFGFASPNRAKNDALPRRFPFGRHLLDYKFSKPRDYDLSSIEASNFGGHLLKYGTHYSLHPVRRHLPKNFLVASDYQLYKLVELCHGVCSGALTIS